MTQAESQSHELTALGDPDGDIHTVIPGDLWTVPGKVWVEGGKLLYDRGTHGPETRPGRGMFAGFLKLGEAGDDKIREYAAKWGVLSICRHQLPSSHSRSHLRPAGCDPLGYRDDPQRETYEPIEKWRMFSRQAVALLKISYALRLGQIPSDLDWATAYEKNPDERARNVPRDPVAGAIRLSQIINEWVALAAVRPVFEWHVGSKPSISFGSRGLFGAIALQLCFAVSQSDGFIICTHCRTPFQKRERAPKSGQRPFCPECRAGGIPKRYSAHDARERKKKEQSRQKLVT